MLGLLALVLVLALAGCFLWARSVFGGIERVDVDHVLSTGGNGTNYLIVGSDSREGMELEGPAGQRSDTMMILHLDGSEAKMLSIPRDLYVYIPSRGGSSKLNAAYNADNGPASLVETITTALDIPVHHYMEVDFVSFAGMVDGLGGVTVPFEHPAYDDKSGLFVPEAGDVRLDGEQSLAYVRSRTYTEVIDGTERTDPTADIGRIQRQQAFLRAVFGELSDTKSPLALGRAGSGLASGLRIDEDMTMFDAMRLGWAMRKIDPTPLVLPVTEGRNESGAVLFLNEAAAQPVLDQVR